MSGDVSALVDHLFRHEAGRLVSRLVRRLDGRLDLAEDAVQYAMVQALRTWPFHGVPEQPGAWLARVAHNKALDALRAARRSAAASRELAAETSASAPPAALAGEIDDDRLSLMFACSHPIVPHASRVALTLNVVGGFGVREIARAFVVDAASMAQRLVRAKRLLAEHAVSFEVPAGGELNERLDAVLQIIYLLFNEGYDASSSEEWVRSDLCDEALRLVELVVAHPATATPAAHALAALLYLLAARLPGRLDAAGAHILLDEHAVPASSCAAPAICPPPRWPSPAPPRCRAASRSAGGCGTGRSSASGRQGAVGSPGGVKRHRPPRIPRAGPQVR